MKKIMLIKNISVVLLMIILLEFGVSCDDPVDATIEKPTIDKIEPDHSFANTEVTIIGSNFRTSVADNKVTFNGTEAEVLSSKGNELTVLVPADASTGDVIVVSNNLTSNSYVFTVDIPIIPTITSIDPNSGNIGDTVIITGTDFSTVPEENIVSFNGGIAIVIESTETTIKTTVPNDASTGNVTVTRDGASNGVMFTVTTPIASLTVAISDENDDVEEGGENGAMALSSSDLELGEYDTWEQNGVAQGNQTIGLRFNNITIPEGATILSASIQFTTDATGAEPVQMTIYGENTGNAGPYTEDAYNVSGRPKTTSKTVWDIPEWINVGDAGDAQKTADLRDIVQEIVNRTDWTSGNSINFIMVPTVYLSTSTGGREAEAGVGDDSAILTITYQE